MASMSRIALYVAAIFSTAAVLPPPAVAQTSVATNAPRSEAELEQLLAPIALYPDALLSQILMAATYPLEVVEAARWQNAHPGLEGDGLEYALKDQDWDPSVKSLVAFPSTLAMMSKEIRWTTNLGNAFLDQREDVMDAAQALRQRAYDAGNLPSGAEQTVTAGYGDGGSRVIRIEPTQTNVVYVPVYNPTVVYGPWPYAAYQPFYWYPPGYASGGAIFSFGVGLFVGHALWGGYDWHRHDVRVVNVYNYNRFSRHYVANPRWSHDQHPRFGAPQGDRMHARRFQGADNSARFGGRGDGYRTGGDRSWANTDRGNVVRPGNGGRGNADAPGRNSPGDRGRDGQAQASGNRGNFDGPPRNRPNTGTGPSRNDRPVSSPDMQRPGREPGVRQVGGANPRGQGVERGTGDSARVIGQMRQRAMGEGGNGRSDFGRGTGAEQRGGMGAGRSQSPGAGSRERSASSGGNPGRGASSGGHGGGSRDGGGRGGNGGGHGGSRGG